MVKWRENSSVLVSTVGYPPTDATGKLRRLQYPSHLTARHHKAIYNVHNHNRTHQHLLTTMTAAASPTASPTTQQPNPLRLQYNSRRALIASIEANKRAISVIERQEAEIQKQLENKLFEKRINMKLWEKHRAGRKGMSGE
jgi:hypothetical protein